MAKRIGILTGGGDCPGLNPAIRGCVVRALDHGYECVGLLEGWKGLVEGNSIPLALADVQDIVLKGGTILGDLPHQPLQERGGRPKVPR